MRQKRLARAIERTSVGCQRGTSPMHFAMPPVERGTAVITAPDFDISDFSVGIAPPSPDTYEREIVLLSPLESLVRTYDLLRLPRVDITQIQFKNKVVPKLVEMVLEHSEHEPACEPTEFRRARMREIITPDGVLYRLDVKGKKTLLESGVFSRPEFGMNLDLSQFNELLDLPTKGFTVKTRYAIPFHIFSESAAIDAIATPDIIRSTGQVVNRQLQPHHGTITLPPFVLTDIEFANELHVSAFRSGAHNLALAHNDAIEVATLPSSTRKAFSASRIAKHGINARLCSIVRRLQAA